MVTADSLGGCGQTLATVDICHMLLSIVSQIIFLATGGTHQLNVGTLACVCHHGWLFLGRVAAHTTSVVEMCYFFGWILCRSLFYIFSFWQTFGWNSELIGDRDGSDEHPCHLIFGYGAMHRERIFLSFGSLST